MSTPAPAPGAPIGLLAELTHRCPLRCPYCSNPVELTRRGEELDTATWARVLDEAAALGVLHVHLSGGEPTARSDIVEITAHCATAGLYSNLITSGAGRAVALVPALAAAGLDHVQLSVQAASDDLADRIGGRPGAHAEKRAFAAAVTEQGLALTLNAVIHAANADEVEALIALAVRLGARRLEIAHTQYYGWALANRDALMPSRDQVARSVALVDEARRRLDGVLVIDFVAPDYFARFPKACMGGWGRRFITVTPAGLALPCHAAAGIPELSFWSVRDHDLQAIWSASPAFAAFRGTDWMREPCRSCERREVDWGGCRCQAMALTGDPRATDPVCSRSPAHTAVAMLAQRTAAPPPYRYRGFGKSFAGAHADPG